MTPVRLNVFQKTQRLWDTFHPYNAAQAMELDGEFLPDDVATAFNQTIGDLGLGRFSCDGRSYVVQALESQIQLLATAGDFESAISAEMNRPFDAHRDVPFRPFCLTCNGRRVIGLTYQHWVADSVSIRLLMRQWLARLVGDAGPARIRWPTAGLLGAFGPAAAGWSVMAQTASLLAFASRMKRMRRVDAKTDAAVRVTVRETPDGLIDAVRDRARTQGRTVGDVFLAAAAEACAAFGPTHATSRRPDLCMGTIVDLRARRSRLPANVFGLYLGFMMTPFTAAEIGNFEALLARTTREKRTGLARRSAEASQLNIAAGYLIGRWREPQAMREFYRKRFPLAGGLSSVNMTPGWAGDRHPSPLAAYHRVSPTGPLLPVVLTPTTLGRTLRVCCTYRTALMTADRTAALVDAFVDRLRRYGGG